MRKRVFTLWIAVLLLVVGCAGPKSKKLGAGAATGAAEMDRSVIPSPGPSPALRLPRIQHRSLSNGLAVLIVEHQELPVVQVSLVIKSGS